jgi:hypothetical protein
LEAVVLAAGVPISPASEEVPLYAWTLSVPYLDDFLRRAEADASVQALADGAGKGPLIRALRAGVAKAMPPLEPDDLLMTDQGCDWVEWTAARHRGDNDAGPEPVPTGRLTCFIGDLAIPRGDGPPTSEGLAFVVAHAASTGRGIAARATARGPSGTVDHSVAFAGLLGVLLGDETEERRWTP